MSASLISQEYLEWQLCVLAFQLVPLHLLPSSVFPQPSLKLFLKDILYHATSSLGGIIEMYGFDGQMPEWLAGQRILSFDRNFFFYLLNSSAIHSFVSPCSGRQTSSQKKLKEKYMEY